MNSCKLFILRILGKKTVWCDIQGEPTWILYTWYGSVFLPKYDALENDMKRCAQTIQENIFVVFTKRACTHTTEFTSKIFQLKLFLRIQFHQKWKCCGLNTFCVRDPHLCSRVFQFWLCVRPFCYCLFIVVVMTDVRCKCRPYLQKRWDEETEKNRKNYN